MKKINLIYSDSISKETQSDYLNYEEIYDYGFTHVNNLNHDTEYIFIEFIPGYPSFEFKETNSYLISDEIYEKILEGYNINLIYMTHSETDIPWCVKDIEDVLKNFKIDLKKVYLLTGNQLLHKIKEKYNGTINVKTINRIPKDFCRKVFHQEKKYGFDFTLKKYLFQCYNRLYKPHRFLTLSYLHHHGLLEKCDWSFLRNLGHQDDYKNIESYRGNYSPMEEIISKTEIQKIDKSLEFILDTKSKKSIEEAHYESDRPEGPNFSNLYTHNPFQHSYINIVTESQYQWEDTIHITEKSMAPFYFYQFPIIVSSVNHIQKMRELYDFDWFDDIINHDYDSEIDNEKRLHKIMKELSRLNTVQEDIISFYYNNQDRFEHNKKQIEKIDSSEIDRKFFKSFIL